MRRPWVAGNWKMNGSQASNTHLLEALMAKLTDNPSLDVVVFPPFVYLQQVSAQLKGSNIAWGAQNVSNKTEGAFTGETSASMLKEFGCQSVLIGHSERRHIYSESNALVAEKYAQVQAVGLQAVLCVGETKAQRDKGETEAVIQEQVNAILHTAGVASLSKAVIAYEPVWAIGTGDTATPEQAQVIHAAIRAQIAKEDAGIAEGCHIVYGGSVKGNNAKELFAMADIDGGLVGGASLKADEFAEICLAGI